MDGKKWSIVILVLTPVFIEAWQSSREDTRRDLREISDRRDMRRGVHYHTKRHMLPANDSKQRRVTTQKSFRDMRKKVKPSGHLAPLEEDDMDNDEVVSVAIGPPPIRPKYDKAHWKHPPKVSGHNVTNNTAVNIVKDILSQLGRELLSRQVSEDFVFGQYVGNSMKNLTADLKLKMQHELLEIIVKYQRWNRGEVPKSQESVTANPMPAAMMSKETKPERKFIPANETEDTWPDFSNLAKIVG